MEITINHLLLWESSLVSLKPLEVGELHFRTQGGRLEAQIRFRAHFLLVFNYKDALPFSGSLTSHMKTQIVTSYQMGASSYNGGPLCPPTQKEPQRPLFLFWPTPREPVSTLQSPHATGCSTQLTTILARGVYPSGTGVASTWGRIIKVHPLISQTPRRRDSSCSRGPATDAPVRKQANTLSILWIG